MKQINPFLNFDSLKQVANKMVINSATDSELVHGADCKMPSLESIVSTTPILVCGEQPAFDFAAEECTLDIPDSQRNDSTDGKVAVVQPEDSAFKTACQILPAFLLAGLGMVGAGLILNIVQKWEVFVKITELFILVPPLLGLKGNLEMTLASRLSTQANLGTLNKVSEKMTCIIGNLVLTQCQAIVVGCVAAIFAILFGAVTDNRFNMNAALLVVASSIITASFASFVLGSITIAVVLMSTHYGINPDNIATPLAASLGDISTIALLAGMSSLLYDVIDHMPYIGTVIILVFAALTPLWVLLSYRNKYVQETLKSGWVPILVAMGIALIGGFVLDYAFAGFDNMAKFQPVVNGLGGNVAAIQASRISTYLHKQSFPGNLATPGTSSCVNPLRTFINGPDPHYTTARVLMILVIPSHLMFMYIIVAITSQISTITGPFVLAYLLAVSVQVALLLYLTLVIVRAIWTRGDDPDNAAIPYLTAIGDLLGIVFLFLAFSTLDSFGLE